MTALYWYIFVLRRFLKHLYAYQRQAFYLKSTFLRWLFNDAISLWTIQRRYRMINKREAICEITHPTATLSTANYTWHDLHSNTDGCGGKPTTNRLSYGTAFGRRSRTFRMSLLPPSSGYKGKISMQPAKRKTEESKFPWLTTEEVSSS
jgi:hypothetical protein